MKRIPLTQGKFAIVDDADFEWLNQFKWCLHKNHRCSYAVRGTEGGGIKRMFHMHRVILGLNPGDGLSVDHIDNNGLDNRRCNLRICRHAENLRNQRKRVVKKTSQFKGVSWASHAGKWRAQIRCDGKQSHICYCENEDDAARAYDRKARELFGEFAYLQFAEKGKDHEYQVA